MKIAVQMLIVFALLILVTAANAFEIRGSIEVKNKPLRVKRDDGMKSRFYKGKYKTVFAKSGNSVLFRIERKGITTDVPLKLKRAGEIPANGSFIVSGKDVNQTFDIDGHMKTDVTRSKTKRRWVHCTYYVEEWVCRRRGRRRYCDWEDVEYDGERRIEYHKVTKKRTTSMTLASNNGGGGVFKGSASTTRTKITKRGRCEEI